MLQVENEGGSIVRRQLLIPRRQKCGSLRWKASSAQGQSCLDSQPACWAQDRALQQQNMASPAQDPAQTALTTFTSASYHLRVTNLPAQQDSLLKVTALPHDSRHSQPHNPNPSQQAPASQDSHPASGSTTHKARAGGCAGGPDLYHYLMSSFSKGLCSTTRQGLSERPDGAPATGGDLEGELLPNIFLFAFGVASLLWTLWGKRSCKIRSRNSSTICHGKSKR